jgi:hypothetical protein
MWRQNGRYQAGELFHNFDLFGDLVRVGFRGQFRKDAIVIRDRLTFCTHNTKERREIHIDSWSSSRVFEKDRHVAPRNFFHSYGSPAIVRVGFLWYSGALAAFKIPCSHPRPPILLGRLPSNGRLFLDSFNAVLSRLGLLPQFIDGTAQRIGNSVSFLGLQLGGYGKIVSIFPARPHFKPLKANKDRSSENYYKASPCPSERRALEVAHALFYFFEIGFGGWLGWDGVFWLGFSDRRRAYRGIAFIFGAILLVCHGAISVTQKHLTQLYYCNTVIHMANVLNTDKQIAVIGALAEGSSIRSIERITGVHRDTVMLGVRVGAVRAFIVQESRIAEES